MGAAEFLKERFRRYYVENAVPAPPEVGRREFGYGGFGEKISTRHLALAGADAMNKFLRTNVPLYISHSVAYYRFPDRRPMHAKEFLGADVIYEFDADDLKEPCSREHDSWRCKCGASGSGVVDACPKCGKAALEAEHWVCEKCLEAVKRELLRLLEFIEKDFGIGGEETAINFSGNRGYHLHLQGGALRALPKEARTEMLDYLTAIALKPELLGFSASEKSGAAAQQPGAAVKPPKPARFGWAKRIEDALVELFRGRNAERIASAAGTSVKKSQELLNDADTIIGEIERGFLRRIPGRTAAGTEKFWGSLIGYAVQKEALHLDRQTSIDISKLIRVPGTLHGSTGLAAVKLERSALAGFRPLERAVVLSEKPVAVRALRVPKFALQKQRFGPYENEVAELPEFAAVYLLARGAAELAPG